MNGVDAPIPLEPRPRGSVEAGARPDAGLRKAAVAFEGIMVQMMMKEMQNAQLENGLFGDGTGTDIYQSLFNQHLSERLSEGSPFGIADMLMEQWTRDQISPEQLQEVLQNLEVQKASDMYKNVIESVPQGHSGEMMDSKLENLRFFNLSSGRTDR